MKLRLLRTLLLSLVLTAAHAGATPQLRFVKQWGDTPLVLDGAISEVGFAANAPVAYAVSAEAGSVRVFEVPTRKTRLYLPQHALLPPRPRAALTPDGTVLAATVLDARGEAQIRLFDTLDGRELATLSSPGTGPAWEAIAISRDGKRLLAVHESVGLFAWDLRSGKRLWQRPRDNGGGRVTKIAWLPDHRTAILFEVATVKDSPTVVDTDTGADVERLSGRRWKGEASRDGAWLLGLNAENIDVWALADKKVVRSIPTGESQWALSAAFSADASRVFASGPSARVREIDARTGRVMRLFQGHAASVDTLAASGDGRYLISGSDDRTVRVWDLRAGREVPRRFGHLGGVLALGVSMSGEGVFSAGSDGEVRVYGADGAPRGIVRPAPAVLDRTVARAAAFDLTGRRYVFADDQTVACRDLQTGRLLWQKPIAFSGSTILDANDKGEVLLATGMTGFVFSAQEGNDVRRFERGRVTAARFAAQGRQIVWSDPDHPLEVLDAATGRSTTRLAGHRGDVQRTDAKGITRLIKNAPLGASDLVVAPNGRVLASSADRQVALWSLPGGGQTKTIRGRSLDRARLAFSPDSQWLVAASDPGVVTLIDVAKAREAAILDLRSSPAKNQEFAVAALAFLPNGRSFLLGTRGGSIYELTIVEP